MIEPLRPEIQKDNPSTPRDLSLERLFRRSPSVPLQNGFQGGPVRRRSVYQITLWSWMAALIDSLFILAISCFFLLAFCYIVKSPAGQVLQAGPTNPWLLGFEIFLGCSWIYMVLLRSFLASSLGEWACGLRLGWPQQQESSKFILQVIARSTLVLLTGLVVLPFFSLLLGTDLAGKLSGLKLLSEK